MSSLHSSTFEYLAPTAKQIEQMAALRTAASDYAIQLDWYLPGGPDKTFILRQLRTIAMWANVALTRGVDGRPRTETELEPPPPV